MEFHVTVFFDVGRPLHGISKTTENRYFDSTPDFARKTIAKNSLNPKLVEVGFHIASIGRLLELKILMRFIIHRHQKVTAMKFCTLALAAAFALSSTLAFAQNTSSRGGSAAGTSEAPTTGSSTNGTTVG
jgi:hypothetical protein